jgi:hypothetical protein
VTEQPKRPRRIRALPPPAVDEAPRPDLPQIGAIKSLAAGTASEHQQRLAWDFILREAAAIKAQSFRSNDALGMAFMEGRRFVASTLLTIANIDTTTMKDDDR